MLASKWSSLFHDFGVLGTVIDARKVGQVYTLPWWRHQMETFSALPFLCAGNSPVAGEFPAQRPVTRSFGLSFDLRLNKRLSKQSWGWWFETPSRSLWRHRDVLIYDIFIAWSCVHRHLKIKKTIENDQRGHTIYRINKLMSQYCNGKVYLLIVSHYINSLKICCCHWHLLS